MQKDNVFYKLSRICTPLLDMVEVLGYDPRDSLGRPFGLGIPLYRPMWDTGRRWCYHLLCVSASSFKFDVEKEKIDPFLRSMSPLVAGLGSVSCEGL